MNIFFGKISTSYDVNQLKEGYYQAVRDSSWFNGIAIGDYAYVIGGGSIQLWRAREWQISNEGNDRLYFDILNKDLGISIEQFVAFNKFYLDKSLIVKTTRSTAVEHKAFFPLQTDGFDVEDLTLFEDLTNFRKIYNRVSFDKIEHNSKDLQLYFEDNELKLAEIDFADFKLVERFDGSIINNLGKGSKNKDKIIRKIISQKSNFGLLKDVKIQHVYDTFMCKYVEKKEKNQRRYWVVNGYDLNCITYDLENDMFVMQQQYNEQNNSTVSGLLGKCKKIKEGDGVLLYNSNLYYAYGEFKKVDFESNTVLSIDKMKSEMLQIDNQLAKFSDAECYFEDTRDENGFHNEYGQRLLVEQWNGINLSGTHISGIANEAKMVNTTIIELRNYKFYDTVVKILDADNFYLIEENMKELKNILDIKKQLILQGPPGSGKTRTAKDLAEYLLTKYVTENKEDQAQILKLNTQFEIIQFHPAYTYEDFIRGIVTEPHGDKIQYVAKDKLFLELVEKAKKDTDNRPYVLIIDEINRANLSAVLGELIYALEYRDESFKSMYADQSGNYDITIPSNLYIIGTMNTADKSVGHIDYALRRRFAFYDVLPKVCDESNFEKNLFIKVSSLFVNEIKANVDELEASDHLSIEFQDRPQDIWMGHSYFIKKENQDFSLRIKYEIVPILQEYVKDGILNNTTEVKNIIKEVLNYTTANGNF